jgi:hypothetical protein
VIRKYLQQTLPQDGSNKEEKRLVRDVLLRNCKFFHSEKVGAGKSYAILKECLA